MTIGELQAALAPLDPEQETFVVLFTRDDTAELFEIEAVSEHNGHAQLQITEAAEASATPDAQGNGAVRLEASRGSPGGADATLEAFLDWCARRGVTAEEKVLIWNAMAFLCYDQVESRHGPFY